MANDGTAGHFIALPLRRAGLVPEQQEEDTRGGRIGFACFTLAVVATFVLIALVMFKVI